MTCFSSTTTHIHTHTQACEDNHKVKYRFILEFIISLFPNVLGRSLFNLTFRLTGSCKDGSECSLALFPSMPQVTRLGYSNKSQDIRMHTACADVWKQHGSQDAGLSPCHKDLTPVTVCLPPP